MKITTNFTQPVRNVLVTVFILTIALTAFCITTAYYLAINRSDIIQESEKLKQIMLALSDKNEAAINSQKLITESEVLGVRRRIEKLNSYTPIRRVSVNRLLKTIEDILPDGVRIKRLGYSAIDGQLVLVTETNDQERIYLFLKRLEQSSIFEDPLLQQHSGIAERDTSMAQYEIHVVVRKV